MQQPPEPRDNYERDAAYAPAAPAPNETDLIRRGIVFHGKTLKSARDDTDTDTDTDTVRTMVEVAKARNWKEITVRGGDAFRRNVWLEARLNGIGVRGYNQVLKAALRRVVPLARRSEELSRKASQVLSWMADVDDRPVRVDELDALPMNRLTQRYARALMMARWFLSAQAPDLRRGRSDGVALLFDMNVLFQRTLGALIRRVLPAGLHLREEGPRRHLAIDQLGQRQFQMRPDLCILQGDEVLAIADAKWKLLEPEADNGRHRVAHSDVYQLHAYASTYQCGRVALWYPQPAIAEDICLTGPVFTLAGSTPAASPSQLRIQSLRISPAVEASAWNEAMATEIESHLRTLLGSKDQPTQVPA